MSCRKNIFLNAAATFFLVAAAFSSCSKENPDGEHFVSLSLPLTEVGKTADSQFLKVSSNGDWTLELDYEEGQTGWARLEDYSGSLSVTTILHWDPNNSGKDRQLTIIASCGGKSSSIIFKQSANATVIPVSSDEIKSDPVPGWLELPNTDADGRYFIRHDIAIGPKTHRNYSLYLSAEDKIAVWVAYPLNSNLISSGSRPKPDPWALDPKVPAKYQPIITEKGFKGYDRGHQIPQADRYITSEANLQTFYCTNAAPQLASLNQDGWESLEGYVREWSRRFDTLYVVTGADVSGNTKVVYDRANKAITVPSGYFKALLGYKKGASSTQFSGQVSGYIGIAFYFKHEACDASQIMNHAMSITELERKLGYDFYVNLPARVGSENTSRIESTRSAWWGNNI